MDHGVRQVSARWAAGVVRRALVQCRGTTRRVPTISVLLTTDRRIRAVHKKYLNDDTPTDVISFDHGEIIVSVETARRYAKRHGIRSREEIARYLVHGLLHLFGYDDRTPRKRARMFARQERLLRKMGI